MSNNIIMFFNTNSTQNVENMSVDFNAYDAQIINCTVQLTSALNYNAFSPYDTVTCTILNRCSVDDSGSSLESNIRAAQYLRVGTKINGNGDYVAVGPLFKINTRNEIGGGRWTIKGYSLIAYMNTVDVDAKYYNYEEQSVSNVISTLFSAVNFPNLRGYFCNVPCSERVYGYMEANSARNIFGQISLAYSLHAGYNTSCLTNGMFLVGQAGDTSVATVQKSNIYVGNSTTELDNSYSVNIIGYNYSSEEQNIVSVYDAEVSGTDEWKAGDFTVRFSQSVEPDTVFARAGLKVYAGEYSTSRYSPSQFGKTYPNSTELYALPRKTTWGIKVNGICCQGNLPTEVTETDLFERTLNRRYPFVLINSNTGATRSTVAEEDTIKAMVELLKYCPNSEQNTLSTSGNGLNSAWRGTYYEEKCTFNIYFSRIYMQLEQDYDRYIYYAGAGAVNLNKYVVNGVSHDGFVLKNNFPLPWSDACMTNNTSTHTGNLQIYGKALEYDSTLSCTYQTSGMPTVSYSVKDIRIITSEGASSASMSSVCSRFVNYAKSPRIEKISYPWDGKSSPGNLMTIGTANSGLITETSITLSSFPKATSTVRINYTGR